MAEKMNVAIIGTGLQCKRRAPVVQQGKDTKIKVVVGKNKGDANQLAKEFNCEASYDWKSVVERKDIDIVIVCTPPNLHAPISIAAMRAGKHVLCEKPLAKTVVEAQEMVRVARETKKILKCGFNHRHHPAVEEAKKLCDQGMLGKILFVRCRYGICARPEYEQEWRADPKQAAGGQLMEQGVHAIDLIRWFLGDLKEATGMLSNHYLKKMPLEDDGMALFRSKNGATALVHTSLAQWKNLFSFEVFGEKGYALVEGLGGSYGEEKLIRGKHDANAPFRDEITYFRGADKSWQEEWDVFIKAIKEKKQPIGNAQDGLEAMRAADAVYQSEKEKRIVMIAK